MSGGRVAPPGLEEDLWRALPRLTLAALVVPLLAAAGARWLGGHGFDWNRALLPGDMLALGAIGFLWTMLLTLGMGCWVVKVMKGPRRTADDYPLPKQERDPETGQLKGPPDDGMP